MHFGSSSPAATRGFEEAWNVISYLDALFNHEAKCRGESRLQKAPIIRCHAKEHAVKQQSIKIQQIKDAPPAGFTSPTALPTDESQQRAWQQENQAWWQKHSMRYDFSSPIPYEEFTEPFYDEIDRRFFESASHYLPPRQIPFDRLIDFDSLRDQDVLEIGCGNGSHAQLLASRAKSYTGIDLTDYAVRSTSTRLALRQLPGTVLQMDAEAMKFPDHSFDFIWTWGVIHHSANTPRIIQEMNRVLRPGGRATVMVYYRGLWNFYAIGTLISLLNRELPTPRTVHSSRQSVEDGALARYYRPSEWRRMVRDNFSVRRTRIYGQKDLLILLPGGGLKRTLLGLIPDPVGRLLTGPCRMGNFLVADMQKNG
jgi:SAM-dependent methyltransferase